MRVNHKNRNGYLLGLVDFATFGLFFLLYMSLGGLQDEIDEVLGRRTQRYWIAYLLGIPTLFVYTLIWMARIAEEIGSKAEMMGLPGPYTSFRHMFFWNLLGTVILAGPMISTGRFFRDLDRVKAEIDTTKAN